MQKFRKYIYCNNEILSDFINQIDDLSSVTKGTEKEVSSSVSGEGNIVVAKIDSEILESTKTIFETRLSDVERFISWCEKTHNYLNINENIPEMDDKGVICSISGKAYLPEMVNDFQLLESFKDNLELLSTIGGIGQDGVQQAQLLKNSNSVPILIDSIDNYVINCSVVKKHLRENINDFFESIDDEITIIGRIDNVYLTGEVEIFDIAKESLRINRSVRRKMTPEQLRNITAYEEAPLIKITPIIIYK